MTTYNAVYNNSSSYKADLTALHKIQQTRSLQNSLCRQITMKNDLCFFCYSVDSQLSLEPNWNHSKRLWELSKTNHSLSPQRLTNEFKDTINVSFYVVHKSFILLQNQNSSHIYCFFRFFAATDWLFFFILHLWSISWKSPKIE